MSRRYQPRGAALAWSPLSIALAETMLRLMARWQYRAATLRHAEQERMFDRETNEQTKEDQL